MQQLLFILFHILHVYMNTEHPAKYVLIILRCILDSILNTQSHRTMCKVICL